MASFTTQIKDEISKIETNRLESISEVLAYLNIVAEIENQKIILFIENASTARRMFSLIKRIYGINVELTIRTLKRFKTVFPACGSTNSAIELTIKELEKYSNYKEWIDVSDY